MERFQEPSTWAGIGTFLGPLAGFLPGTPGLIVGCLSAACGAVAVKLREGRGG